MEWSRRRTRTCDEVCGVAAPAIPRVAVFRSWGSRIPNRALFPAFLNVFKHLITALSCSTPHSTLSVWRRPRNEPLVDVNRAVLIAVHHQTTVLMLAAIRALPQWHILLMLALVA